MGLSWQWSQTMTDTAAERGAVIRTDPDGVVTLTLDRPAARNALARSSWSTADHRRDLDGGIAGLRDRRPQSRCSPRESRHRVRHADGAQRRSRTQPGPPRSAGGRCIGGDPHRAMEKAPGSVDGLGREAGHACVFGSAARRDGGSKSDIDLMVVHPAFPGDKRLPRREKSLGAALGDAMLTALSQPLPGGAEDKWYAQFDELRARSNAGPAVRSKSSTSPFGNRPTSRRPIRRSPPR
jgi:hypothetical protein